MVTLAHALALASVWLSPAALLAMGPTLLADGTRGLWLPLVLGASAVVTVVLLGEPWGRLRPCGRRTLVDLLGLRWPTTRSAVTLLAIPCTGSALLFLWAQLAAGRELGRALGWSTPVAVGASVAVLALATWREKIGAWLVVAGSAGVSLGLLTGLVAVMITTTPAWPRVWDAVASRTRIVFPEAGPSIREGRPVRGVTPELTLSVTEEQRVTLLGRGRARVDLWEGGTSTREVRTDTEVTLRPGDRLVIPDGFPVRFQAGRAVPGAPANGLDWLDPVEPRPDWRALTGLGLTLIVGALGLAPVHAALPAETPAGHRGVRLAASLVVLGCIGTTLWCLYAIWLTPEIYTGGVAAFEVYELPGGVAAFHAAGAPLRTLALLALAGGGLAAGLTAVRAIPRDVVAAAGAGEEAGVTATLGVASVLAVVAPADPWPVLLAAFGLAASAGAPAAVLGCWRAGLSPRALVVGAGLGLVLFVLLSALRLVGLAPAHETSWIAWVTAWPAVLAAPANALVVWLLSPAAPSLARDALPPDLAALHNDA